MNDDLEIKIKAPFPEVREFFHCGTFEKEWKKEVPDKFEARVEMKELLEEIDNKFIASTISEGKEFVRIECEKIDEESCYVKFDYPKKKILRKIAKITLILGFPALILSGAGILFFVASWLIFRHISKKSKKRIAYSKNNFLPIIKEKFPLTNVLTKQIKFGDLPDWIELIPYHLRPEWEQIRELENLRSEYNIPPDLFAMRILSSPSSTIKTQRHTFKYFSSRNPFASERDLLRMVLKQRLQTPPITEMSKEEIDAAMENINSFEDLCDYVISIDEQEPSTPDPLGIGKKIDAILAREG